MKVYNNPSVDQWNSLGKRPCFDTSYLEEIIDDIFEQVKRDGDQALANYTSRFDNVKLDEFAVEELAFLNAQDQLSDSLKRAIEQAKQNIEKFHLAHVEQINIVETMTGVSCWRKSIGIDQVGLYIPGGSAPLFSTVLMLGVPAQLAGCKEVVICTPCNEQGVVHPAILYAAQLVGISKVYRVGGAQAIAALTFGTKTISPVKKIFGPGNQFVTRAKLKAQELGVAIDMPAGPSEVLIIADRTASPEFVAADLLAQAEHGADSQVLLLATDRLLIQQVLSAIEEQLDRLPRKEIASKALENSCAIYFDSLASCMKFSNQYAPEHLILSVDEADEWAEKVINAGSVFIGNYSCESAGDYASGTNHTLPTNGNASMYSGVSVDSFVKKITFQKLSAEGLQCLGPIIEVMADAEQLAGHKNAVTIRLKSLAND